jgi:hypothetical protein
VSLVVFARTSYRFFGRRRRCSPPAVPPPGTSAACSSTRWACGPSWPRSARCSSHGERVGAMVHRLRRLTVASGSPERAYSHAASIPDPIRPPSSSSSAACADRLRAAQYAVRPATRLAQSESLLNVLRGRSLSASSASRA